MIITRRSVVMAAAAIAQAAPSTGPVHKVVYQAPGRFGGWPANFGSWSWGDEILVGFGAAWFKRMPPERHQSDSEKPKVPMLARTMDGGETWNVEAPRSLLPPDQGGKAGTTLREPMDFTAPGFAMTLRLTDNNAGLSRLWFSYDKGKEWSGPFELPLFGQKGIMARTDYVILGRREALVFLTASKSNGREGRPLCARTTDGGMTWQMRGWIGEEPKGFSIMPSSVRLPSKRILTAVRVKEEASDWIDVYETSDDGVTWKLAARPVASTGGKSGNPPSLIRLRDGRLCLTYGYRGQPYGIRAVLSRDEGKSWGKEIAIRSDGAAWDIGYPRSAQRGDGKVVTAYYFPPEPFTERIIAASIWDPGR